jgi:hypothetical protein
MSEWTHAICGHCWGRLNPNQVIPIAVRKPEIEVCCFCGALTAGGIYVRQNPRGSRCKGTHMRGPSDVTESTIIEIQDLKEENRQLKEHITDLCDENHELSSQVERYLNYIAELETEVADLKATLGIKDVPKE